MSGASDHKDGGTVTGPPSAPPKPRPRIEIDFARYDAMLDAPDMDESQKREFLTTLWQIIVQFVDLGFGVHPVQAVGLTTKGKDEGAGAANAGGEAEGTSDGDATNAALARLVRAEGAHRTLNQPQRKEASCTDKPLT